jgi:hypothetical protein
LFVDPAGNPTLQSVTFFIGNGNATSIPFQAYVYSWTGSEITGNALFASAPLSVAPTGGSTTFDPVTISGMNTTLVPGQQYVAFFSTIGFTGPIDSSAWQLSTQASYPEGKFLYNNSTTFAGLFDGNPPWNNLGDFGNASFIMHFTSGVSTTPEPSTLAIAGVSGLIALVYASIRRRS